MISKQINKIVVDMLGYSLNTWVNLKEIHRITVAKWENIYTYDDLTRVKFDEENQLVHVCGVVKVPVNKIKYYPANVEKEEVYINGELVGYYVYKSDKNGVVMEDLYPYENIKIFTWKRELEPVRRSVRR